MKSEKKIEFVFKMLYVYFVVRNWQIRKYDTILRNDQGEMRHVYSVYRQRELIKKLFRTNFRRVKWLFFFDLRQIRECTTPFSKAKKVDFAFGSNINTMKVQRITVSACQDPPFTRSIFHALLSRDKPLSVSAGN